MGSATRITAQTVSSLLINLMPVSFPRKASDARCVYNMSSIERSTLVCYSVAFSSLPSRLFTTYKRKRLLTICFPPPDWTLVGMSSTSGQTPQPSLALNIGSILIAELFATLWVTNLFLYKLHSSRALQSLWYCDYANLDFLQNEQAGLLLE